MKKHEVIEFKTIEGGLPERIVDESPPDNFRLPQRNLMMLMMELLLLPKPYIYKTYAEARAVYRKCLTVNFWNYQVNWMASGCIIFYGV